MRSIHPPYDERAINSLNHVNKAIGVSDKTPGLYENMDPVTRPNKAQNIRTIYTLAQKKVCNTSGECIFWLQ